MADEKQGPARCHAAEPRRGHRQVRGFEHGHCGDGLTARGEGEAQHATRTQPGLNREQVAVAGPHQSVDPHKRRLGRRFQPLHGV